MPTTGAAPFTATVRMIYRIHCHASNSGAQTSPTTSAGLTELASIVLPMAYFANRRSAIHMNLPPFTRTQTQCRVGTFPGSELSGSACSTNQLCPFSCFQFNAVHHGSDRNISKRQRVARLYRRLFSRRNAVTRSKTFGRKNVAALTICIQNQRKMCAAIWIIFDVLHATDNPVLVSLEINLPVASFVPTTTVARRDSALVISPTLFG